MDSLEVCVRECFHSDHTELLEYLELLGHGYLVKLGSDPG